jgi:hypothetical protein
VVAGATAGGRHGGRAPWRAWRDAGGGGRHGGRGATLVVAAGWREAGGRGRGWWRAAGAKVAAGGREGGGRSDGYEGSVEAGRRKAVRAVTHDVDEPLDAASAALGRRPLLSRLSRPRRLAVRAMAALVLLGIFYAYVRPYGG